MVRSIRQVWEIIDTALSVCRKFNDLATPLAFGTLVMDNVRPSRMPMLAYLLKKNPFFGRSCRKLQLQMNNRFKTRTFPLGKGTTSHQDEAQAQAISSLPRLESLSIALEYAYGFDLTPP